MKKIVLLALFAISASLLFANGERERPEREKAKRTKPTPVQVVKVSVDAAIGVSAGFVPVAGPALSVGYAVTTISTYAVTGESVGGNLVDGFNTYSQEVYADDNRKNRGFLG